MSGTPDILVLWPEVKRPDDYEDRFMFGYCRRQTERLLDLPVRGYDRDLTLAGLRAAPGPSPPDAVLLVTRPDIVVGRASLDAMLTVLSRGGAAAVGPMFSATDFPGQVAAPPFVYLDEAGFLEVEQLCVEAAGLSAVPVPALDPACVLLGGEALGSLPGHLLVSDAAAHLAGARQVAQGTLVHTFAGVWGRERPDLAALVPAGTRKLLDIGCAGGGFGRSVRKLHPGIELVGLEANAARLPQGDSAYDRIITGAIEDAELPNDFDCVNMGDVIEHLHAPWDVLAAVRELLRPNGCMTGSVPNIGHWSVVKALAEGNFEYVPAGLLCVGHLRHFTRAGLEQLIAGAGFGLDVLETTRVEPTPRGQTFIDALVTGGYGKSEDLETTGFLFRAVKGES